MCSACPEQYDIRFTTLQSTDEQSSVLYATSVKGPTVYVIHATSVKEPLFTLTSDILQIENVKGHLFIIYYAPNVEQ